MLQIADDMQAVLKKHGKEKKVLIGCEGNAAEPFINHFVINDSRHNMNYGYGTPVAAYNYIFHEYACNFMGNQNTSHRITDYKKYPDNLYYRYAHSFAQGDVLTIVLKDKGQIHWDWCTPWDAPEINQEEIRAYLAHLNSWRKNIGKSALVYGRMVKPFAFDCGIYEEAITIGGKHLYNSVETACYQVENGKKQQFFVNYLPFAQTITLKTAVCGTWFEDAKGINARSVNGENIELIIPARSVCMLEV